MYSYNRVSFVPWVVLLVVLVKPLELRAPIHSCPPILGDIPCPGGLAALYSSLGGFVRSSLDDKDKARILTVHPRHQQMAPARADVMV